MRYLLNLRVSADCFDPWNRLHCSKEYYILLHVARAKLAVLDFRLSWNPCSHRQRWSQQYHHFGLLQSRAQQVCADELQRWCPFHCGITLPDNRHVVRRYHQPRELSFARAAMISKLTQDIRARTIFTRHTSTMYSQIFLA